MVTMHRGQRGFTLIEVMCATSILIIGMLGVYTAELASARSYSKSRQLFVATSLATTMLEMAKIMPPSRVQALKSSGFSRNYDVAGKPVQGNQGTIFYRVALAPAALLNPSAFTVTVTWPDSSALGQTKSLQMSGMPL